MYAQTIMIFMFLLFPIVAVVGIFFAIRYFIRYNAKQKRKHSEQSEMDKMKIDDLE